MWVFSLSPGPPPQWLSTPDYAGQAWRPFPWHIGRVQASPDSRPQEGLSERLQWARAGGYCDLVWRTFPGDGIKH